MCETDSFIKTYLFSKSDWLDPSNEFSSSILYGLSKEFLDSKAFSKSGPFLETNGFSKATRFLKTDNFSQSMFWSPNINDLSSIESKTNELHFSSQKSINIFDSSLYEGTTPVFEKAVSSEESHENYFTSSEYI